MGMEIYIVEDDMSVVNILLDIIESCSLGRVSGYSGGEKTNIEEILVKSPDVVLVDFLMPGKDGIQVIRELKSKGCTAKIIMISQVSTKEMIAKAYNSGIDFFINKPINLIEVRSVISSVEKQLKNERILSNLHNMFMNEISAPVSAQIPSSRQSQKEDFSKKLRYILNKVGMSGEKGAEDIVRICEFLQQKEQSMADISISRLCEQISDTPKNMEQRVRRAIAAGMSNVAHLGIEDYMNEVFTEYSNSLFPFEEIRCEMDHIRGKSLYNGKVNVKKFIDSLMLAADQI